MFSWSSSLSSLRPINEENGCSEYSAKVKITTAMAAGRNTITYRNEQINAGNGPQKRCNLEKLSNKKAYSPPLLGITVPNSAKHKAPKLIRSSVS